MKGSMKTPTMKGPLKKSTVNPTQPNVKEASPAGKAVRMAPKINQEPMGKRVIQGSVKPNGNKSTFRAPRSGGGGSVTDLGYTKLGKA